MVHFALPFGEVKIQLNSGGKRVLTDTTASEKFMVLELSELPDPRNRRPHSSSALCIHKCLQYSAYFCSAPHHLQNTYIWCC